MAEAPVDYPVVVHGISPSGRPRELRVGVNQYEGDAALRRDGVVDTTQVRYSAEAQRPVAEHIADYPRPERTN